MSAHADHDAEHAEGEHDDHDDHHAAQPLEEPATPLWLTLLGIGLFLVAGILFVATREAGKTTAELTAAPSEGAVPAASAVPTPSPAVPGSAAPTPGAPGAQPALRQIAPGMQLGGPPPGARPPGAAPAAPTPAGAAPAPVKRSQQPGHEGHNHD